MDAQPKPSVIEAVAETAMFAAVARWATVLLMPITLGLSGWLLLTVHNGQVAHATLGERVGMLERADQEIKSYCDIVGYRRDDKIGDLDRRLATVEAQNGEILKQLDRIYGRLERDRADMIMPHGPASTGRN